MIFMSNIINLFYSASFLEVNVDKPGNIGPNQIIKGITVNELNKSILQIKKANEEIYGMFGQKIADNLGLGEYIYKLTEAMLIPPPHENFLLGHILLMSPLAYTLFQLSYSNPEVFWENVSGVLEHANWVDSIWVMRAIKLANPGGLDTPGGKKLQTAYDLTEGSDKWEQRIRDTKISFKDLFLESAEFDTISQELTSNYSNTRKIIQNYCSNLPTSLSMDFILDLFIHILSKIPDSLIYRKNNQLIAKQIQNYAKNIVDLGYSKTSPGLDAIKALHKLMMEKDGKYNPGTTADLTATIIFILQLLLE